jgi:hypothetical protein
MKVFPNGTIITIAGSGNFSNIGWWGDGGPGIAAGINRPLGVSSDGYNGALIAGVYVSR